jgi:hypothetical protein
MQQLQDAPTTAYEPPLIDSRERIAAIEFGGHRFRVDYIADDDGTQHFDLEIDGVHCANTPVCCISVSAEGRVTNTFNTDAESIGVRPGSESARALRDAVEELASLIDSAAVLRDHGVQLTGAGYALLRAVAARPALLHAGPARTAPFCHLPVGSL